MTSWWRLKVMWWTRWKSRPITTSMTMNVDYAITYRERRWFARMAPWAKTVECTPGKTGLLWERRLWRSWRERDCMAWKHVINRLIREREHAMRIPTCSRTGDILEPTLLNQVIHHQGTYSLVVFQNWRTLCESVICLGEASSCPSIRSNFTSHVSKAAKRLVFVKTALVGPSHSRLSTYPLSIVWRGANYPWAIFRTKPTLQDKRRCVGDRE